MNYALHILEKELATAISKRESIKMEKSQFMGIVASNRDIFKREEYDRLYNCYSSEIVELDINISSIEKAIFILRRDTIA